MAEIEECVTVRIVLGPAAVNVKQGARDSESAGRRGGESAESEREWEVGLERKRR